MSGCPSSEVLTAMLDHRPADGYLLGAERRAVREHVLECDECLEVVSETMVLQGRTSCADCIIADAGRQVSPAGSPLCDDCAAERAHEARRGGE